MFQKHGFCLLNSPTEVKFWNDDHYKSKTDIDLIYHKEIKDLIEKVIDPEDIFTIWQNNAVVKRGPGSKNNNYLNGIHQDVGFGPKEWKE